AHALAGVKHCARGLAHYPLRQVAVVWQGDHPPRVGGEVLSQAPHTGTRQDDDSLSLMKCLCPALHHHASTLMARPADCQRVMLPGVDGPITMPNITAADRHPLQLDEALAVLDSRHLYIEELEELGTYQLCRFHINLSTSNRPAEQAQCVAITYQSVKPTWTSSLIGLKPDLPEAS